MGDEMVSAMNFLVRTYEELQGISPEHELLRFIEEITSAGIKFTDDETLSKEFLERFPSVNPSTGFEHKIYSLLLYEKVMREAKLVEYFRQQGFAIEICGGIKRNAPVIDFTVGNLNFPESLIAIGVVSFAVISNKRFEYLEKWGTIVDVAVDKEFTDPYSGQSVLANVGKTDIEINGRTGSKGYQGVKIVGIEINSECEWSSILGREFTSSFDITEMGLPGCPVIGFYGCKKIEH